MNNGRIIFNSKDVDFINEVMDFCGQDYSYHDDAPDILAEFCERIENINIVNYVTLIDRRKLGI